MTYNAISKRESKSREGKPKMSKMYQYTYNNNLIDGVVYIYKEDTTWAYDIMNRNGVFSRNGYKTKKDAKAKAESMVGCSLKSLPIK